MDVLKKGLTASGNVAESHCIPVLAYFRQLAFASSGKEPIAAAKVRISEQNSKKKTFFLIFSGESTFDECQEVRISE